MTYATLLKDREKNKHLYNQDFSESKENYSITQFGEKYNLYEHIQNAREDTEIIPTLEKYGIAKGLEKLNKYAPSNIEKYYGDFRDISDMRNMMDKAKRAEEYWLTLPLEVRQKFGNSKREFFEKGGKWLKEKHDEYIKNIQQETADSKQKTTGNLGDENNG